ncbi:MAG: thermonuclease family protein [Elusimicrobia bacterium]|nr:thermonuclease family protein [Elusimicrobiota bacterium]
MNKLILPLLLFTASLHAQNLSITAKVLYIIDGDTIKIEYNKKPTSVRLIGIDTPESKNNAKARRDAQRTGKDVRTITTLGKQASDYLKTLVKKGDIIKIVFDVQKTDRYGRLLGYVYLSDSSTMLNETIIRAGYASPMTIPPDVKYKDLFLKAYQEARENKRGLWK